MKILRVKLTKGGREYKIATAISKQMKLPEFEDLLRTQLPLADAAIVGFKDSNGVLMIPSLIWQEPEILSEEYELILKEQRTNVRPTSGSIRSSDDQLSHMVTDLRMKNMINEQEYFAMRSLVRAQNDKVFRAFQNYQLDQNLEIFKDRLLTVLLDTQSRTGSRQSTVQSGNNTGRLGSRDRHTANRRTQQAFIQVVLDMENQGMLEESLLGILKTLILDENIDVIREFERYFNQDITIHQLAKTLNRQAEKLTHYIERPQSPTPKKDELMILVNTVVKNQIPDVEDIETITKLIGEENEFVFAAFDVFVSDRDEEELLDSLVRCVYKYKNRNKPNLKIISAGQFYPNSKNTPPKTEIAKNSNDTKLLSIIHSENLEDFLSNEEFGMLVELLEQNNETIHQVFDEFHLDYNSLKLVERLQQICSETFDGILQENFTEDQVNFIKRMSQNPESEIAISFQVFKYETSIPSLIWNLKQILKIENQSRASSQRAPKESDYLNGVEKLSQYSYVIEQNKPFLHQQISARNDDVLRIIRAYQRSKDINSALQRLEQIIAANDSHLFLDFINNKLPEKTMTLQKLYEDGNPSLLGLWGAYKETRNESEFINHLLMLGIDQGQRECEEEFEDALLVELIRENFSEAEGSLLLKMLDSNDERIKTAKTVYDVTYDKEDLLKTLQFLVDQDMEPL